MVRMVETTSPAYAWPDVPRIAFGAGPDGDLNACVGWALSRHGDVTSYLEGSRKAAIATLAAVEDGASPDYLVFPLAFLWRHHLELALKDVIATGQALNGEEHGVPKTHRLSELWNRAKRHIEPLGPDGAPELANVELGILEFEQIDPGSDEFRYPLDRKGNGSLPTAPEWVDVRRLHEAMIALSNFFSGARSEIARHIDYHLEQEASYSNE